MKKILQIIVGLIIIILLLLGFLFYNEQDQNLTVVFFDVGQGDAILIKTPTNQKILIDGGPDDKLITKLGRYFNFYDKKIDLMILTHAHSDHLIGLIEVLKRYQVKQVLYNGVIDATPEFINWLTIIKEQKIPLQIAVAGQEYIFSDDLKLKILYPLENLTNQKFDDLNQTALVSQLIYQKTNFIFMGDLPQEEEKEMLKNQINYQSDVIKIGHHGSKYSTSEELLQAVKPTLAIIQVGKDNKFGHPDLVTLRRLQRKGIAILRTDLNGDIIIESDGDKFYQKSPWFSN